MFDLFFRRCPFGGEFAVFAGLEEALRYLDSFSFTDAQIDYLRSVMPRCEAGFFAWLRTLDCSPIKVYAVREGSEVFARIPLLRVEGPLAVAQLLETTLLNLVNYPSLVATNAARFRLAAGPDKVLLEFGLRILAGKEGSASVVEADDHRSIGDNHRVIPGLAGNFQATQHRLDVAGAVGKRCYHRIAVHLFGLGHANGYVNPHVVGGFAY